MTDPAQYISGRTVEEQMNSLISYVDTRAEEVANAAVVDEVADCQQAVTDAQSARDAAINAKDSAISTVSDCVKMTPSAAQTITGYGLTVSAGVTADVTGDITSSGTSAFNGTVTVPTVATGTADTKAANGTKVINELDNYSAMVRTTGNQTMSGDKIDVIAASTSLSGVAPAGLQQQVSNLIVNSTSSNRYFFLTSAVDAAGVLIGGIFIRYNSNGNVHFQLFTTKADGTYSANEIAVFDRSTGVWF